MADTRQSLHAHTDQASFEEALTHMVREDPSLVVEVDEESGQTVLKGIGELHLEVRARGCLSEGYVYFSQVFFLFLGLNEKGRLELEKRKVVTDYYFVPSDLYFPILMILLKPKTR